MLKPSVVILVFLLSIPGKALPRLHFPDTVSQLVTFTIKVDKRSATKDGAYLNGYLVNLSYHRIQELQGRTIRVSGRVSIIKGKTTDRSGNLQQGRQSDIKYISKPRIVILS